MAIRATEITTSGTIDQLRQQFNNLVTDVSAIESGTINFSSLSVTEASIGVLSASSIEFGASLVFEGSTVDGNELTLTVVDPTADRTITLPDATGTVVLKDTTDTLTNKTFNFANNTVTGTIAEFNTALSDQDFATLAGTETLTNKTVDLTDNTLTGTTAEFNTALSDGSFATLAGTETLTNKTLTDVLVNQSSNNVAMTITNTGTGNSFVIEDSASDTTPFVINDSGQLGIRNTPSGTYDLELRADGLAPNGWYFGATLSHLHEIAGNQVGIRVGGDGPTLEIEDAGTNALTLGNNTNGDLNLSANSAIGITLEPAGNVGIGTTAPGAKLEVNGTIIGNSTLNIGAITSTGNFSTTGSISDGVATLNGGQLTSAVSGAFSGAVSSGSLTVDTSVLVVDAGNDRVGVNIASPLVGLHVNDSARITGNLVVNTDLTVDGTFDCGALS